VALELVRLLDGTRDRPALLQCVKKLVDDGTLVVNENGASSEDAAKAKGDLSEAVEEGLAKLAANALLVG
jgi:hypothetical protein